MRPVQIQGDGKTDSTSLNGEEQHRIAKGCRAVIHWGHYSTKLPQMSKRYMKCLLQGSRQSSYKPLFFASIYFHDLVQGSVTFRQKGHSLQMQFA